MYIPFFKSLELYSILSAKKVFSKISFFNRFTHPPPHPPPNLLWPKSAKRDKSFLSMFLYLEVSSTQQPIIQFNQAGIRKINSQNAVKKVLDKIPKLQRQIPVFPLEICCNANIKHHQNQHKHSVCSGTFYSPFSRYLDFTEHQFLSSLVFFLSMVRIRDPRITICGLNLSFRGSL